MATRIQFRRGTAAQWTSANPVLAVGELGLETDTQKFKIGNGSTAWNSLAYGGIQGTTGTQGIQGVQGTTGLQGITGSQGTTGATGATGSQGTTGTQGTQGVQGNQGTTGTQGATGTQGTQGTQGIQGNQGTVGTQGTTGTQGTQGTQGTTGSQGTTGTQGTTGAQGTQGTQGVQGTTGTQGAQGTTGRDGNFGGATVDYTFDTTTTNADPGTGKVRFNNATISSATEMYIDDVNDNSTDLQALFRTIDDSTSTIKGHLRISNKFDSSDFALFTISGVNEQTGYFVVSVGYVSGSATSFSNAEDVIITFARTGDKGDTGAQGTTGTQGATGTQGTQGVQGTQGIQGLQGLQGSVGDDGFIAQPSAPTNTSLLWLDTDEPAAASGVNQIIAGTNITISPTGGTGAVTINASGGGGGAAGDSDQTILPVQIFS